MALIKESVSNNPTFKHSAYNRTQYLVETFGPRLWGSENLEAAIQHMLKQMQNENFENARLEPVENIIHWTRGNEKHSEWGLRIIGRRDVNRSRRVADTRAVIRWAVGTSGCSSNASGRAAR